MVMGKNQSVRAEVNEDYRIEKGIRLARRFSGGGAVYHDKGNINLTFIETTSQPLFEDYLQRIVGFLETMGVTAYTDERLGIYLDGKKYRAVRNVFIKPCDVSLYFVIFCKLGCTSYSVEGEV